MQLLVGKFRLDLLKLFCSEMKSPGLNHGHTFLYVFRGADQTIEDAKKTGLISTLPGRIRLLPDINSDNINVRQFAERTAVNTPIQGTAADLIKSAMLKTDAAFELQGLKSAMLLSVHDELVFEVPPEELDLVKTLLKETMEGIWKLNVPLKVNISSVK
jgi:DNA polymerase-1